MQLKLILATAAACAGVAPALAADFADPATIDGEVVRFTGAAIGAVGGARLPVDRRLKLARCEAPLALEWYGKRHETVLVRCPTGQGWRLFVPVNDGSADNSGAPAVVRGEAVNIVVQGRGFTLSRQGEALEGGAIGEWIRVRPAGARTDPVRMRIVEPGKVGMDLP
jgi:flagella basal body P-ring formation protein FlgA